MPHRLSLNPAPRCRRASQSNSLGPFLVPTPSSGYDIEKASCGSPQGSFDGKARMVDNASVQDVHRYDGTAFPILQTATATTNLVSDTINQPYPQSPENTLVNHSSFGDGSPVHGDSEGMTGLRPNEEPTAPTILPLHIRVLVFLTIYGQLRAASMPEDFVRVWTTLKREWAFNGGFLLAIAAVNATMFAITQDAIFKVNSYAYAAVSTSSAACGLGITCDVWFLVRYAWVDLETFICRSRDLYDSYGFFSLSSRMPTFCVLVSSISLMVFLGLVAYDGWSVGFLVVGSLVVLVMALQFIVYGTHQFFTSALHIGRSMEGSMVNAVQRFRGLASRG